MTDYFEVLGIKAGATEVEVREAFDELLAKRRARKQRTGDLYAALEVLTNPTLRTAFELSKLGLAVATGVASGANAASEAAAEIMSEIDVREVARQARLVALKSAYVASGAVARSADFTAKQARSIQAVALRRLDK